MTIREYAEDSCRQRGMFPDDAKAVVQSVMDDPDYSATMAGRWDSAADGYPPQFLAVLTMAIDVAALKWIDANAPRAWFRPLFDRKT